MTTPKQVSDFAKEYQEIYIANVQLSSALKALRKQLHQAKYGFDINDPTPEYDQTIEVFNTNSQIWQTVVRNKNAYSDYYTPLTGGCNLKPELVSHWRPLYIPELIEV